VGAVGLLAFHLSFATLTVRKFFCLLLQIHQMMVALGMDSEAIEAQWFHCAAPLSPQLRGRHFELSRC